MNMAGCVQKMMQHRAEDVIIQRTIRLTVNIKMKEGGKLGRKDTITKEYMRSPAACAPGGRNIKIT